MDECESMGREFMVHITNYQFVFVKTQLRHAFSMARPAEKSKILKSFGANVRRLRFQAGLTQAKLAERVEVELRTEQKFEAGEINVPLATLVRIRNALDCRWEELLGKVIRTAASHGKSDTREFKRDPA
jgi:DNA-binding XRE family transcriptional regulator